MMTNVARFSLAKTGQKVEEKKEYEMKQAIKRIMIVKLSHHSDYKYYDIWARGYKQIFAYISSAWNFSCS